MTEQRTLRISIVATVVVAAFGIVLGLLSGSAAIIFDGVYSLLDASMTILALVVSGLIAATGVGVPPRSKLAERFTMGFWHLEPIVLVLNSSLLIGAAVYALINAVNSIIAGGRALDFDNAILYAVVTLVVTITMAVFSTRASRRLKSDFLVLDAKAWIMSSALTGALLIAFVFGYLIQNTRLAWLVPFVDPAVLIVVCLVIIPIPIGTLRQALADILLVTPADFKRHVDEVAAGIVKRHGFISFRSYVARVGRGRQIELYFIVPRDWPPKQLEEWDRLRDEIGIAIGEDTPDRWLTIMFTTDPEWAD